MAPRFEIVHQEDIEEWKDKSENENTKNSTEWWENVFKKWADERNLHEKSKKQCPRPTIGAVLSIQKFSNFALYVITKKSQWILEK